MARSAIPRAARAMLRGGGLAIAILAVPAGFAGTPVNAQSIEPRAYSPAPVGTTFFLVGYAKATGGLSIDPALPVEDPRIEVGGVVAAYATALNLWGKAGKVDVIIPYGKLSGEALFLGEPVERRVTGFGDPLARITIILVGAPALSPAEFRAYRQDFLLGVSLQVGAPFGQYDETRLLNLGQNRWSFKPEIGLSKTWGQLTTELAASATIHGANDEFFRGTRRKQKPIYSGQASLIYSLKSGIWGALTVTYLAGGETKVDGVSNDNLQKNWRAGLSVAVPISRAMSVKAAASKGVSARTGNNFDLVGITWQYRWIPGT